MVQKPFSWDKMYIYLSGSIDYAPDGGAGWRDIITEKLIKIEVPHNHILNPLKKPIQNISANLNNESQVINERRQAEDWVGLVNVMAEIVHVDLRLVDLSSIVIVNFLIDDKGQRIPSYFTVGELQAAKKIFSESLD